jgi:hypothetical protein
MSINHLLSVDDSLLLLKINDGSAQCLQNILSLYEDCSGQIINKEKSSIMFSRNTNDAEKQELMASLDIPGIAGVYWEIKIKNFCISKGQSMKENSRLEEKAHFKSWERNFD